MRSPKRSKKQLIGTTARIRRATTLDASSAALAAGCGAATAPASVVLLRETSAANSALVRAAATSAATIPQVSSSQPAAEAPAATPTAVVPGRPAVAFVMLASSAKANALAPLQHEHQPAPPLHRGQACIAAAAPFPVAAASPAPSRVQRQDGMELCSEQETATRTRSHSSTLRCHYASNTRGCLDQIQAKCYRQP
jgi:hypothetical protein